MIVEIRPAMLSNFARTLGTEVFLPFLAGNQKLILTS